MKKRIKKTIDLIEYGAGIYVPIDELCFLKEPDLLDWLNRCLNPLVTVESIHDDSSLLFKPNSHVGTVVTRGLRIQVRPRLSVKEFCTLIRYAVSGQAPPHHFRAMAELTWDKGFEDVLSMLLADECKEILRVGLSRRYEERQERLKVLRGRPLWERNFPWGENQVSEIACRYHQMTYDNLDNRIVVSGLRKAAALALDNNIKHLVVWFLKTFTDIAHEKKLDFNSFENAEHRYNRLNEHYRVAHGLSKMLLFGLRGESMFDEGRWTTAGCAIDMSLLFEKFVERFAADFFKKDGLTIFSQKSDNHALLDSEGNRYAAVRPDIEIWKDDQPIGIIDSKYKMYWRASQAGFSPDKKISNADLYQLFFYQQRMMRKYRLSFQPIAVIVSPLPDLDEREAAEVVSKRYKRVTYNVDTERSGTVHLALLPITRFLRLLRKHKSADQAIKYMDDQDLYYTFLKYTRTESAIA